MNREENSEDFSVMCVEPYQSEKLKSLNHSSKIELIQKKVQTMPHEPVAL